MPVERAMPKTLPEDFLEGQDPSGGLEFEIDDDPDLNEDGSMDIDLDEDKRPDPSGSLPKDFDANVAEALSEGDLTRMALELTHLYDSDLLSRAQWERDYREGLAQLGMRIEDMNEPWDGACGVFHPLMSEALVRFQSQLIQEVFPASGPARYKITGKETDDKIKRANRVQRHMNWTLTEQMMDYRAETERLIYHYALAGSAFRKTYYDPTLRRPDAKFVPAEDFVIEFSTTDLRTSPRYTHTMKRTTNEIRKYQRVGFYRDTPLRPPAPEYSEIDVAKESIGGVAAQFDTDTRHTLLEMHVDIELPEEDPFSGNYHNIALPYIVTVDKSNNTILAIRRNWKKDDDLFLRRQHFVQYIYIPGIGFYGYGLAHLVGGTAKTATSLTRQLVDAGTLSNIQGGFKSRDLRIVGGDDIPIAPGEWRDVEVVSGSIKDNLLPLPVKEPSPTLHALLGDIVEEGRRFASLTDLELGEMSGSAPVGTTLALLERKLKVVSAIQARFHDSQKQEFKLISDIIRSDPAPYPYEEDEGADKRSDYGNGVEVTPVADPNAATMSMRIVQTQAALDMADRAPHLYDMARLHRRGLAAMDFQDIDRVLPLPEQIPPTDPVSENMNIITGRPVKVHSYQDHAAHIAVHMLAAQDPKIMDMISKSPNAVMIEASAAAHIVEHLAHQYRAEIERELGTPLPPYGEPLPPEIEARLSKAVAAAATQLFNKDMAAAKAQAIAAANEDPIIQGEREDRAIKREELQHKMRESAAKTEFQYAQLAQQDKAIVSERALQLLEIYLQSQEAQASLQMDGAALGVEAIRAFFQRQSDKERMKATTIARPRS